MKQETIDKLLVLANTAFQAQESSDKYARNAAHEAAHEAAFRHNPECADAAVLIATNTFNMDLSDAIIYSARVADAWNSQFASGRDYCALRESFDDNAVPRARTAHTTFFSMVQPGNVALHSCATNVTASYSADFVHDTETKEKAKQAALYVYRHTWSVARSAYVVSMFDANKIQNDPLKRQEAFNSMMTTRLNNDLKYDQIEPGFLLKIMCSLTTQAFAGLMLLGGIIVIVCGALGIAALPFVPTIVIGSTAAGIGTSILVGSFFSRKEQQNIDEKNERCEEVNTIY